MPAFLCTSRARSLAATKPRPGGVIRPFCEPDIATSMPHASISNGMQPSEATASTMNSAGWPADSLADRLDVVVGAGGGVDLHCKDCLDRVMLVLPQAGFD